MAEPHNPSIKPATTPGDATESRTGSEPRPTASGGYYPPAQQNRGSVIDRVKERATAQLTTQKDRGTEALGSITQAVRSTSQRLRDEKHETIAGYVDQAADRIETWTRRVKEKNLDEIVTDVHRLARQQPAVFIGSAFALGVLGARFLKSSRPDNDLANDNSHRLQYGGGTRRSSASDRASTTSGANAEVAIAAHEVAVPDEFAAAPGARRSVGDNSGTRSTRIRQPGTEKP